MEFLANYGLFLAKSLTFVAVVFVIVVLLSSLGSRKKGDKGHIEVIKLNEKYEDLREDLREAMMDEEELKAHEKAEKKRLKDEKKAAKKATKKDEPAETELITEVKGRVFVVDFDGDIKASQVENLREEITSILSIATPADEVVIRLESGGGMVHTYGLASSQLNRITKKGIKLTACVDKVAASGGYMMACVANKIIAAPFAVLGSIGVVAQVPNLHKLLKKNDIDYDIYTAGKYKRTVTVLGENTEEGKQKFVEDLHDTHDLFKGFVKTHRPSVDVEAVANGDVWYGSKAIEVNLVDEVATSDEYLFEKMAVADVYSVHYKLKKSLPEKFGMAAQASADKLLLTWWDRLHSQRWFQ